MDIKSQLIRVVGLTLVVPKHQKSQKCAQQQFSFPRGDMRAQFDYDKKKLRLQMLEDGEPVEVMVPFEVEQLPEPEAA